MVLWYLVTGLDRQKFTPIVVLPTDVPYEGKLSQALEQAGISHYCIKMGVIRRRYFNPLGVIIYVIYLIYGVWQLGALIKRHRIVLVHSNTSAVLAGALAARLYGLPHVWHVHEILEKPAWFGRLIYRFILANSSQVVAISQAVANHISRGAVTTLVGQATDDENGVQSLLCGQTKVCTPITEQRIQVIWDGIDCQKFNPQVDGQSLRQAWGIGPDELAVGVVGRISHWKGQELFIKAASQAIKQAGQLRFVIVGGPVPGDEMRLENLQKLTQDLGLTDQVKFVPFSQNVPEVMRALDILVLPSTWPEPLGLVVLEAMASERPVIAAAHGGPLETVLAGETGFFFKPRDASSLAEAMMRLAGNPELRQKLGDKGRQRVLEHFSLENFRQQFTLLYAEMLQP